MDTRFLNYSKDCEKIPGIIPLFLFPGIFGMDTEYLNITPNISSSGIYAAHVYREPRRLSLGNLSFIQQIEMNAKEIIASLNKSCIPCFIVGYSHGCTLAVYTALYLKRKGTEVYLYLIDAAIPEYSLEYFSDSSDAAISDLISIAQYAEMTTLGKTCIHAETIASELKSISSLVERIEKLKNKIVCGHKKSKSYSQEFETLIEIWLQDIASLQEDKASIINKLPLIKLLLTTKTALKYGFKSQEWDGGWSKYAEKIVYEDNSLLLAQDHSRLLSNDNNSASNLSNSIIKFFNNIILNIANEPKFKDQLNEAFEKINRLQSDDYNASCRPCDLEENEKKQKKNKERPSKSIVSPFEALHTETLINIFSFFDKRDLAMAARVCKVWRVVSCDKALQDLPMPKRHYATIKPVPIKPEHHLDGVNTGSRVTCIITLPDESIICGLDLGDLLFAKREKTGQWKVKKILGIHGEHNDSVTCLAILPNGNIVSSSKDGSLKIWTVDEFNGFVCIKTLKHDVETHLMGDGTIIHLKDEVHCVAVLQDGSILSGSEDGILKIWNAQTGECKASFTAHDSAVICIASLPDGNFVSGSSNGTLKIWDVKTLDCKQRLDQESKGHSDGITSLAIIPDNNYLVSGSIDHTIKIWNINTGECIQTLTNSAAITCLAVLHDGNIACGGEGLQIWHFPYKRKLSHDDRYHKVEQINHFLLNKDLQLSEAHRKALETYKNAIENIDDQNDLLVLKNGFSQLNKLAEDLLITADKNSIPSGMKSNIFAIVDSAYQIYAMTCDAELCSANLLKNARKILEENEKQKNIFAAIFQIKEPETEKNSEQYYRM